MAAKFFYQPRLADLSSRLKEAGVPADLTLPLIAMLEKRDRELEDYVNKLEARCTAAEARLTAGGL